MNIIIQILNSRFRYSQTAAAHPAACYGACEPPLAGPAAAYHGAEDAIARLNIR